MSPDTARGDALIERILTEGDVDGKVSAELIGEFYAHDYPVEKLLPLLRSGSDETVKTGVFLVAELGPKAAPLMSEVAPLLAHREPWVKADLMSAVLNAASGADGTVIAGAVGLVEDPDRAIRRYALDFLSRASHEQLAAAVPFVADADIAAELSRLVEAEHSVDEEDVRRRLGEADRLVRWFAAVAAARAYRRNPELLDQAIRSDDEELREFAEFRSRWLGREGSRGLD